MGWFWFERLYSACLYLYPADYRRDYGPLMLQAARDLCRDTQQQSGIRGLAVLWGRILIDSLVTAMATRRDRQQQETLNMNNFTFGQLTDTGILRPINEDSVLSRFYPEATEENQLGLFVVADGLGGHPDGDKASKLIVKVISDHVADQLTAAQNQPLAVLAAAIQAANSAVRAEYPQGGAAVTAVILQDNIAHIAQVGDTRAYLVTGDELEQLTVDHSLVQRLISEGKVSADYAPDDDMRSVLYRAVGQQNTLEVDTYTHTLPATARLLLCSDGLWMMVEAPRILEIINSEANPQEACDKLIALANHRGGKDNITAIVVNIQQTQFSDNSLVDTQAI